MMTARNMTIAAFVLLASLSAVPTPASAATGAAVQRKELPEKWKHWLNNEVVYIISDRERRIFLQLENDEQRGRFVELFWQQRDPTPGTERNEFREEHERRLAYADETFGRGSTLPGRLTDRGRMYIILGAPRNRYDYPSDARLYPTELWFYEVDPRRGLPAFFYLIFFRRFGAGDYVLYNPVIDGPRALMALGNPNTDPWVVLRNIDVNLADAAFSYLPVGSGGQMGRTNLSSLVLLGKIDQIHNTDVDATYAERILAGDQKVETLYTFVTSELESIVVPVVDERGRCYIDLAVALDPEQISLGSYEKKVYGALKLDVHLGDADGRTLHSESRDIDFDLTREDFETIKSRPFLVEQRLPCIPGRYSVDARLRNEVSREQFYFSGTVTVPPVRALAFGAGQIVLAQDLARLQDVGPERVMPMQFADILLTPNPQGLFSAKNPLTLHCPLYLPPERRGEQPPEVNVDYSIVDSQGEAKVSGRQAIPKQAFSDNGIFHLFLRWPLNDLPEGGYTAVLKIDSGAGEEPLVRSADFSVSLQPQQPPVRIGAEAFDPDAPEELLKLGRMWRAKGYLEQAEALLWQAAEHSPVNKAVVIELAGLEIEMGKPAEAVTILEMPLIAEPDDPALLKLMGTAYYDLGEFGKAAKFLQRLLESSGESIEILNFLGHAYDRSGEHEKALEAWKRSLELDPNQEEIRKLVSEGR
jgi:GWxTD domain-containing protein